jgi:CBS domain containing-hemolysin-like protein
MEQLIFSITMALGVSGFCSISEAAFYSITPASVEKLMKSGRKSGLYLKHIKDNIDRYIASVLILNTLANTLGVYLATSYAVQNFSENWVLAFPWMLTIMILLFAEIVPKTTGVTYASQMAPIAAMPFYYINKIFTYIGLVHLALWLTKSIRKPATDSQAHLGPEELHNLASLSARMGIIDAQQEKVIKNILELKKRYVREIMTPRHVIFSLPRNAKVRESIEEYGHWSFSRVPIYNSPEEKEKLVGHVLRREAYTALASGRENVALKELTRPLKFIPESMPLDELLSLFLQSQTHILAVSDEYGGLAGIVTLEDVLEELLGKEIVDEFDQTVDMQEKARNSSAALLAIRLRQDKSDSSAL